MVCTFSCFVSTALRTRENKIEHNKSRSDSGLYVKHKGKNKSKRGNKDESGKQDKQQEHGDNQDNKGNQETRKCFHHKKVGHLKKNCYKLLNKKKDEPQNNLVVGKTTDACNVLNVTTRKMSKCMDPRF